MGSVQLAEPNPDWPRQFNAAATELRSAMADATCVVEHIGSTAMPGLCAKPVLDLLLGVKELAAIEVRMTALAMLGYRYRPDYEDQLPQRRYFVRDASAGLPRIHLHGLVADGEHWRAHLAFRDALRNDRALAQRYGQLKRELAERHAADKAAYTAAKAPFIFEVLAAHPSP